MVTETLDILHDQFPGCQTLAFADLSTQMVLVTNSSGTDSRETLDALCAEAALAFGTAGVPALGTCATHTIFVSTADQLHIYLRDTKEPGDALCCLCRHDIALDRFVIAARACLEQISHGL